MADRPEPGERSAKRAARPARRGKAARKVARSRAGQAARQADGQGRTRGTIRPRPSTGRPPGPDDPGRTDARSTWRLGPIGARPWPSRTGGAAHGGAPRPATRRSSATRSSRPATGWPGRRPAAMGSPIVVARAVGPRSGLDPRRGRVPIDRTRAHAATDRTRRRAEASRARHEPVPTPTGRHAAPRRPPARSRSRAPSRWAAA